MSSKTTAHIVLAGLLASLAGCASVEPTELGEGKQEFEQYAQGGNYRFQYVAEGSDGYRTVLWRQGETLSDDSKDGKLVAGVVKSVFHQRFCKEMKQPASLQDGSPAPLGKEGKWVAVVRCAAPPPPPPKAKPEKKKPKPKPAEGETASGAASPDSTSAASKSASSEAPSSAPAKPAVSGSSDGPVTCTANAAGGFDCKPKR